MTTHCNHRTDSQGHYCAECRARWDRAIIVAALRATHERSGVQTEDVEPDQPFVEMLWKWFEDRGVDLRPERSIGLTADEFRIMLDEHEAALLPSTVPSADRLCSCKASARDGQHMAWCPAISSTDRGGEA